MQNKVYFKNYKAAKRYSEALMELSSNCDIHNIYNNLAFAVETFNNNAELKQFFSNPVISKQDKEEVLKEVFKDLLNAQVLNFLCLLLENNRIDILTEIFYFLEKKINDENNIVKAQIMSAIELDENQKNNIVDKLQIKLNKVVKPEYAIDASILGGLVIKIEDTIIDLSIKNKLAKFKQTIER